MAIGYNNFRKCNPTQTLQEVMIMKVFNKILKVFLALAAVAGIIYTIAAYGERIVAWAKNLLETLRAKIDYCCNDDEDFEEEFCDDVTDEEDFEA